MKKRVGKTRKVSQKSALSGAIRDLENEINKLGKDKSNLKRMLSSIASSINVDHSKERELQQEIARLIEKEAQLNQRKKNLQAKIDSVADKLNKISKIKSEMSDI